MKRKRNACFRKIQNCVLLCDVLNRKNSCTIQDYVYTIQVTLLNPVSKKCNEKIIWAKRKKKYDKMATIRCTVSASGLASGI